MKTQISRLPATTHAPFSGVYQQQGRMITDTDWNALSEIAKTRLDTALDDVIGKGTPDRGGIVTGDEASGFQIVWGDAYVDGIRGELRQAPDAVPTTAFDFAEQADFPSPPDLPTGARRLYLDLWERSLTALEEGDLIDPALHGADTTTRTRTMLQVKWGPQDFDPEDIAQNPPIGQGRVTLTLRQGIASGDPCEPCLDEIEVDGRVGNYLFRVEVHDAGYDAAGAPNRLVLKWSRENGAEATLIGDEPPGFVAGDWVYEFYHSAAEDSASESHLGYHHPDVQAGWQPVRSVLIEGYPGSPPAGFPLARRWDGYVELERTGLTWQAATAAIDGESQILGRDRGQRLSTVLGVNNHGHVTEGTTILLSLDTVTLEMELGDLQHVAGDYWAAAVREAVHAPGDVLLHGALPQGILHHYMCLADVAGDGALTLLGMDECKRFRFPKLTDLHADDICYDKSACQMPGVDNVQEAIDHLCQQRDLRWHNKHLHGWGIVCGLIVECCDDQEAGTDAHENPRECVIVTEGYAIDCEGEDIVLSEKAHADLIEEVHKYDEEHPNAPILSEGAGTACLTIGLAGGQPTIGIEPHDLNAKTLLEQILDGTLLGDFIQHCVLDLIAALTKELSFLDPADLPEADGTALVSVERRKMIAFGNLIIQIFNRANGSYVWLSKREHDILHELYDALRGILRSKTFCAMFASSEFPDYLFPDTKTDTWFGADNHTRVKADPTGKRVYTYGGSDAMIHVHDVAKGELVEIIEMNAAEGAEVTAIACSPDGSLLYVAASVKGEDTILGVAQIGDLHRFERPMIVLCGLTIAEMEVDAKDLKALYATGIGGGLFVLRPDDLRDQEKPQPDPDFAFNAVGHMAIDPVTQRAFCTVADPDSETPDTVYWGYAVCDLTKVGDGQGNVVTTPFADLSGKLRRGGDDIAVKPARNTASPTVLYAVVDGPGPDDDKEILTIDVPRSADGAKTADELAVEATGIALAYHSREDVLLAAFEDSYRLQLMSPDGSKVIQPRVPVQIQPTDVTVGQDGTIQVVNFLSGTVTTIPFEEAQLADTRLTPLATYRYQILLAYYSLFGGLLQYLKDCLCHHLLIKCPECDGTEKIYLACVEIRDDLVYNICNFGKRKYVQTFMAWNYWLSIIPIANLLKIAISKACCSVLPNLLDQFADTITPPPPPPETGAKTGAAKAFKGSQSRGVVTTYKRTDLPTIRRQQQDKLGLYGRLARDVATVSTGTVGGAAPGIRKEALQDVTAVETAVRLEKAGINVVATEPYDEKLAGRYAAEYARTPGRLAPGSDVVVYVKDGKTVLVAERRGVVTASLDPAAEAKLAQLEARTKAIEDVSAATSGIATLEERKGAVEAEMAALSARVDALRSEREAEDARLTKALQDRDALRQDLDGLNAGLAAAEEAKAKLRIEIDGLRPVESLEGLDANTIKALRTGGIVTIGDLAGTNVTTLRQLNVGADAKARRDLINVAKTRLQR